MFGFCLSILNTWLLFLTTSKAKKRKKKVLTSMHPSGGAAGHILIVVVVVGGGGCTAAYQAHRDLRSLIEISTSSHQYRRMRRGGQGGTVPSKCNVIIRANFGQILGRIGQIRAELGQKIGRLFFCCPRLVGSFNC